MWGWIIAVALFFLFSSMGDNGDPIDGALTLLNEISGRGARLTHAPADALGVVEEDPQGLADLAGMTLDQYAAARMLSSEEGRSDPTTKAAICWCLVNEASRRGVTLAGLLLQAKNPAHDGYFGSQKDKDPESSNYNGSDRYASTAIDPYDDDRQVCVGVLTGTIRDFTGGCQQFDRPAGEKDPDRVATKRIAAGAELVAVAGVDAGLRFWRS